MLSGIPLLRRVQRLPEVVTYHAGTVPDRDAVVYRDIRLTYAELDGEIDRYARALLAAGVGRGDRVAMLSTPRVEFLLTLLATMRIGAVWVGLNPRYQTAELRYMLEACRPTALLFILDDPAGRNYDCELSTLVPETSSLRAVVTLDRVLDGISIGLDEFLTSGRSTTVEAYRSCQMAGGRRDAVAIVFTSGSTGRPKGAMLSHDSFFHSYKALAESFAGREDLRAGHRTICNLPINHVGCQADLCANALIDAGTIVFMDTFDPPAIAAVIERERISVLGGLPLMHQQVFDHPEFRRRDTSSLKAILWGGAAMPRPLLEQLAARGYFLSMHYGLTEGGSINSVSGPEAGLEALATTVGRPDHDNRYRIMISCGTVAGAGEIGEVQIQGPGVMLGYFGDTGATAEAFTSDGWLRTNDLVEVRSDGAWRFVGRSAEMYKSGGYNIYPREIELALEEHPAVSSAAVVGVPDPIYDEVGWAFVIPVPGACPSVDELRAFAAARLANYKVPKRFLLRDRLPMLPIGKVDKRSLKSQASELPESADGSAGAPVSSVIRPT